MEQRKAIEVFYDGSCRLCSASRAWVERRDPERRLRFRDLCDPAAASLPVPPERLRDAMCVRLPEGGIASGFDGWVAVLRALPRWRRFADVLDLRPLRWVGSAVYRVIARHRYLVGPR